MERRHSWCSAALAASRRLLRAASSGGRFLVNQGCAMMSSVVHRSVGLGRNMWWMRCCASALSCTVYNDITFVNSVVPPKGTTATL